ncbi:hypothetical protein WICPIJ_008273 [Wickerhamomyces pijperi]|uniref:Peptidase A1 domain-containing protein n=1 Tax=Wickerhamomyces pijperi TaxID=599730 RepID=A0A9P8Q080_WICPI|nr:hypothetical protein WICPIJ_008273 [Wickerhamomyces pijperi]
MIITKLLPVLLLAIPTLQSTIPPTKSLEKRDEEPVAFPTIHATGTDGLVYHVDVNLGYKPQEISLRVDIAQPHIWVLDSTFYPECPGGIYNSSAHCQISGAYNLSDSITGVVAQDPYVSYTFPDLVQINGTIVQDNYIQLLNLSTEGYYYPDDEKDYRNANYGTQHDNFNVSIPRFISVNSSNLRVGALGLAGPNTDDSYMGNDNILKLLSSAEFINSSSYSLYPQDEYNLDIILGGVNQSLYFEPLVIFNKIPYLDRLSNSKRDTIRYNYPIIPLTNVLVNNAKGSTVSVVSSSSDPTNATIIPVMLDTRATYTYLPYDVVIKLAIQLNAFYSSQSNSWFVKCSVGQLGASLGFQFGNVTVNVPVSNFLAQVFQDVNETDPVLFDDGSDACLLSIVPNTRFGYSIIGSNVLQAMYLAVDNTNDQVAIAQANNGIYSQLNNTYLLKDPITTTAGSFSASVILSDSGIPFVQGNNVSDIVTSVTFSSASLATDGGSSYPAEITAMYTSGRLHTGDPNAINSFFTSANVQNTGLLTNTASTKRTTDKFSAAGVALAVDGGNAGALMMGVVSGFVLMITGFVL